MLAIEAIVTYVTHETLAGVLREDRRIARGPLPEHLPGLAGLGELALVALALMFCVAVVPLGFRVAAHAEGQKK